MAQASSESLDVLLTSIGPKGNAKIGKDVLTVSRPLGDTCPSSCPFMRNGKATCYASPVYARRPNIQQNRNRQEALRNNHRDVWRRRQLVLWRRQQERGKPIRLLVDGDLIKPGTDRLDIAWLNDIIWLATQSQATVWGYTHCWRQIGKPTLRRLTDAGIHLWASVHNRREARAAKRKGFRVARVIDDWHRTYAGPRGFASDDSPTASDAIVCPHQTGHKASCEDCGFCFRLGQRDLVFLRH